MLFEQEVKTSTFYSLFLFSNICGEKSFATSEELFHCGNFSECERITCTMSGSALCGVCLVA